MDNLKAQPNTYIMGNLKVKPNIEKLNKNPFF
jgi:hypothetical protein